MRPGAGRSMAVIAPDPVPAVSRRRELGLSSARSLLLTVLGEYVLPAARPAWRSALAAARARPPLAPHAPRPALGPPPAPGRASSTEPAPPARRRPPPP